MSPTNVQKVSNLFKVYKEARVFSQQSQDFVNFGNPVDERVIRRLFGKSNLIQDDFGLIQYLWKTNDNIYFPKSSPNNLYALVNRMGRFENDTERKNVFDLHISAVDMISSSLHLLGELNILFEGFSRTTNFSLSNNSFSLDNNIFNDEVRRKNLDCLLKHMEKISEYKLCVVNGEEREIYKNMLDYNTIYFESLNNSLNYVYGDINNNLIEGSIDIFVPEIITIDILRSLKEEKKIKHSQIYGVLSEALAHHEIKKELFYDRRSYINFMAGYNEKERCLSRVLNPSETNGDIEELSSTSEDGWQVLSRKNNNNIQRSKGLLIEFTKSKPRENSILDSLYSCEMIGGSLLDNSGSFELDTHTNFDPLHSFTILDFMIRTNPYLDEEGILRLTGYLDTIKSVIQENDLSTSEDFQ